MNTTNSFQQTSLTRRNKTERYKSLRRKALFFCILFFGLYATIGIFKIIKWKAYIWVPSYVLQCVSPQKQIPASQKHLIFTFVDHFEPGKGEKAVTFNDLWLKNFILNVDGHFDSYGNKFKYTWFYPYDHKNEKVIIQLNRMVYEGHGEIELHWHHPSSFNNDTFPCMLEEAIGWFQQYGALVTSGERLENQGSSETHFAFIHGNWALDGSNKNCGVTNELETLFNHGCFADFTFSTIDTPSQPRKINSIYYAYDHFDKPKSYDDGIDAQLGHPINDAIMIFQGPISFDFWRLRFEYGAVEPDPDLLPTQRRINNWVNSHIHVKGVPEWSFVKVYSHGAQGAHVILSEKHLGQMLQDLEDICRKRGIKLHYMSAREAYNVVKAAEDGKRGDPENYRDYRIPKYLNMTHYINSPINLKNY